MRIIRVFIVLRRLEDIVQKTKRRKKFKMARKDEEFEFTTVEEKVVLGLQNVLNRLDKNDPAVDEIEYAIKQITSNNLYEGFDFSQDDEDESEDEQDLDSQLLSNQKENNTS